MPSFSLPSIPSPARLRTSLLRIPLATKAILAIIILFWCTGWSLGFQNWAQLAPDKVFAGGAHRLSTYPYLHLGLFHTVINIVALTPLLERFEQENGTLVTALLFSGPFSSFPGILYTIICSIFHIKTPVQGASVWSFLLLTATFYRSSLTTPYISLPVPHASNTTATPTPYRFPTTLIPLVLILITSFLIPHTSLLGHTCGALIGYGWGSGLLKFLAPPEKLLRWVEEKLRLRSRLPGSYVGVDRSVNGRYGLNVLPTRETGTDAGASGVHGVVGTGEAGRRLGS